MKQALLNLPINRKVKEYKDKSISELLKMDIKETMSITTVNELLIMLSFLLNYGVRNGYLPLYNSSQGGSDEMDMIMDSRWFSDRYKYIKV